MSEVRDTSKAYIVLGRRPQPYAFQWAVVIEVPTSRHAIALPRLRTGHAAKKLKRPGVSLVFETVGSC
jgi:hypothetical protein